MWNKESEITNRNELSTPTVTNDVQWSQMKRMKHNSNKKDNFIYCFYNVYWLSTFGFLSFNKCVILGINNSSACSVWILFSGNEGNTCWPTPPHHWHLCVIPKIGYVFKLFSIHNSSYFNSNNHYFNILLGEYNDYIDLKNVLKGINPLFLGF